MAKQSVMESKICTERAIRAWPEEIRHDVFRVCKVPREVIRNGTALQCYAMMAESGVPGSRMAAARFKKFMRNGLS